MKRIIIQDKNTVRARCAGIFVMFALLCLGASAFGQDEVKKESDGKKAARPAFESAQLMDEQSVVVASKKTLEFNIQHRFGTVDNGITDLYGIWAPANIRMGFSYTPIDNLAVGLGVTKLKKYVDLNAKYVLIKQRKDWSIPVSVAFFTNVVMDSRSKEFFPKKVYRLSYYEELIIASRLSSKISLQIAPSFSHYNAMDSLYSHNMFAVTFSGRYKISPQSSLMFSYMKQLTKHKAQEATLLQPVPGFKLQPGLTLGVEIATSAHAFQIFVTTLQGIMPQENVTFNQLDVTKRQFLIGFNITRLWGF